MISTKKSILLLIILSLFAYAFISGFQLAAFLFLPIAIYILFMRKIKKYVFLISYFFKLILKTHIVPSVDRDPEFYKIAVMPGGRNISYIEYGAANGFPVFYFHGSPSSCLEALLIDKEHLLEFNLRLICPNRAGIGLSDHVDNRGVSQVADDVEGLANHLGLEKFAVLGFSGGGVYVAACANLLAQRLTAAVVVSGAWKMNEPEGKKNIMERVRLFWKTADKFPYFVPYILSNSPGTEIAKDQALANLKRIAPEADYNFLSEGDRMEIKNKANDDALYDLKGVTQDILLYLKPFDFNIQSIKFPIAIYHGSNDRNVPLALVQKMVNSIPGASLTVFEDEAHISMLGKPFKEIAKYIHANAVYNIKVEKT